jgi:hypothetical protein
MAMSYDDPICLSIVLCDQVIEDRRTGKKSYIGVFNDILAERLPAKHACMSLVVSLTNCLGRYDVGISIARDTDVGQEQILQIRGQLESKSPMEVIDLVFELRATPLTGPGVHTIDVCIQPDDRRIAQRCFHVKQLPERKPRD